MAKSNVKGANFERKIANYLSERFENYLGVSKGFQRSLSSGSFFGGKNAHRLSEVTADNAKSGDISFPVNFKYSIECKHYKTAPVLATMQSSNKGWDSWLDQAAVCSSDKIPLLIVKYNNCKSMVFIEYEYLTDISSIFMLYTSSKNIKYGIFIMEDFFNMYADDKYFNTQEV